MSIVHYKNVTPPPPPPNTHTQVLCSYCDTFYENSCFNFKCYHIIKMLSFLLAACVCMCACICACGCECVHMCVCVCFLTVLETCTQMFWQKKREKHWAPLQCFRLHYFTQTTGFTGQFNTFLLWSLINTLYLSIYALLPFLVVVHQCAVQKKRVCKERRHLVRAMVAQQSPPPPPPHECAELVGKTDCL